MSDKTFVDLLYEHFDGMTTDQEARIKQLETAAELWTRLLGAAVKTPLSPSRTHALMFMRAAQFFATEAIRLEKEGL